MNGLNRDDIIRMARQCGLLEFLKDECPSKFQWDQLNQLLPEFCALVAAAEREACAKACEELVIEGWRDAGWDMGTIDCAAAIRARGQA